MSDPSAQASGLFIVASAHEAIWALEVAAAADRVVLGIIHPTDSADVPASISEVPVLGVVTDPGMRQLLAQPDHEYWATVAEPRQRLALLKDLFTLTQRLPATLVHPQATLSPWADVAAGALLLPGAVVGPGVRVDQGVWLGAAVVLEAGATVASGATLGARVVVGAGASLAERVFIGMGATVYPGVTVGAGATVAPCSAAMQPVADGVTVLGVPAKPV